MNTIDPAVIADVQERLAGLYQDGGMAAVIRLLDGLYSMVDEHVATPKVAVQILLYDAAARELDAEVHHRIAEMGGDPGPVPAFFRKEAFSARVSRFAPIGLDEDPQAYSRVLIPVAKGIALAVLALR